MLRFKSLGLAKIAPITYESSRPDRKFVENRVNTFPQYIASVADVDKTSFNLHFLALFSEKPDAVPLLLLHGWPGSFLEFIPILTILSTRYTPATLPDHIILQDVARLLNTLMVQVGFGDGYIIQGGDIGSQTARILVSEHAIAKRPANVDVSALSERDRAAASYRFQSSCSPCAVRFPPIGEKFMGWTDEDPPMATILEAVSLYWFTETIATSFFPYRQTTPVDENHVGISDNPKWYITKPFGFSSFPKEILPSPRAWIETTGSLVFYREHDKGGHFAALERPETLWKDVEDFVSQVWPECSK
ncbi:Alpha/Beta hydrolase protein [Mycena galericulata]|nr:Alpha/Beta hydrolase protein [Mycena galericulata]